MGHGPRTGAQASREPERAICPACGSSELAEFLYGYPAWGPELEADVDAGRIVLGGCVIHDDPAQPSHRCRACGSEFMLPAAPTESPERSDAPTLVERLDALAAFLPVFERADLEFGTWARGDRLPSGAIQMPYYSFGPEAERFISMAYECGWVTPFDWGVWAQTAQGQRLLDGGDAVAAATPEDLGCILTTLIRAERFGDGQLEHAYRSGLLLAVVRRAAELASQEHNPFA